MPVPGLGGAEIVSREEAERTARSGSTALIAARRESHVKIANLLVEKYAKKAREDWADDVQKLGSVRAIKS